MKTMEDCELELARLDGLVKLARKKGDLDRVQELEFEIEEIMDYIAVNV